MKCCALLKRAEVGVNSLDASWIRLGKKGVDWFVWVSVGQLSGSL